VGRETVSSIAARKGAIAAVNGGFFRIGGRLDGEPEGILKVRHDWYSDPNLPRGAIAWNQSSNDCLIGRVTMKWSLTIGGADYPVDGINRPRAPAGAVLYNWAFHRSTLTDPGGNEILIEKNTITGTTRAGDAPVPRDGFVYSVGPQSQISLSHLRNNSRARVTHTLQELDDGAPSRHRNWETMDYIVGGTPVLIREGRIVQDFEVERVREGFVKDRHPRTAVGMRADRTWVFVVVDGRQPQLSVGMTLAELAEFLQSLGCVSALNLDGGGSSTLVFRGQVMNSPSDAGKERPVSDAILLSEK
jgi:hypothetical protein